MKSQGERGRGTEREAGRGKVLWELLAIVGKTNISKGVASLQSGN